MQFQRQDAVIDDIDVESLAHSSTMGSGKFEKIPFLNLVRYGNLLWLDL